MQFVEIAAPPMGGDEAEHGDEPNSSAKDDDRRPVHGGSLPDATLSARHVNRSREDVAQPDHQ
jgi:hypothetical protein